MTQGKFTKEEKYHLDISKVICDWNNDDVSSYEAMEIVESIDIEYLK